MKPDWKDAPHWAKFRARDADGTWCWFENKPLLDLKNDLWQPGWTDRFEKVNPWEDSLEQRPENIDP